MRTLRNVWMLGLALGLVGLVTGRASAQVSIDGVAYSQYAAQLDGAAHGMNAFDVTRAYINVRGKFDDGITTRVTPDIYRDSNGSLNFRLKYAYMEWTPEGAPVTLRFGQLTTPFIDWEEGMWGFRMQGPVAVDKFHYLTSSDIGAGVKGAWDDQAVNMEFTVSNGEGYHGAEGDTHKAAAARFSVRLLPSDDGSSRGGLRLTGFTRLAAKTGGGSQNRYLGQLSYKSKSFLLAGDFAHAINGSSDPAAPDVKSNLWSVFGTLRFPNSPLGLVARVDGYDPNSDVSQDRRTHLILGVSQKLGSNVLLLEDYEHMSYQGTPTDAQAATRSTLLFQVQFTY